MKHVLNLTRYRLSGAMIWLARRIVDGAEIVTPELRRAR